MKTHQNRDNFLQMLDDSNKRYYGIPQGGEYLIEIKDTNAASPVSVCFDKNDHLKFICENYNKPVIYNN